MKKLYLFFSFAFILFTANFAFSQNSELVDFISMNYIHGVPYAKAKAFGPQALNDLFTLLEDPIYEQFKPNIVAVIGFIGDESAVTALINYVENQEGEIPQATFVSLLVAFQSLGHIAQNGNAEAINYLGKWTGPEYWKTAKLKYTFQNYIDQNLGEVFGRMAIQGLGISGRPEALATLNSLGKLEPSLKAKYQYEWSDNIEEAINLNFQIKAIGAEKLFGESDGN